MTFKFDKSGIGVIATGEYLDDFKISFILPNSSAAEAGLQVGDIITKINFISSGFLSLAGISRILQGREGRKIKIVVRRDGIKQQFVFKLRTLI